MTKYEFLCFGWAISKLLSACEFNLNHCSEKSIYTKIKHIFVLQLYFFRREEECKYLKVVSWWHLAGVWICSLVINAIHGTLNRTCKRTPKSTQELFNFYHNSQQVVIELNLYDCKPICGKWKENVWKAVSNFYP